MNIKTFAIGLALASTTICGAHATVPLKLEPVGYWTGDGNDNDTSTTANDGTFTGSYAPGPGGVGESFNLSTGSGNDPDNPAYQISEAVRIPSPDSV